MYVDLVPDPEVHALDNFASRLSQSEGVTETLTVILASAVDALPGVDVAGVTVRQADGTVETVAFTNPLALEVDEAQRELEQGPAHSAGRG